VRGGLLLLWLTACRFHFDPSSGGDAGDPTGDGDDPTGDGAVITGIQATVSTTGTCAAVAWSGDRAGVVWREGSTEVWFATVDTAGTILDGPIAIGTGLNISNCQALAWTEGQFLVAISAGTNAEDVEATSVAGTAATTFVNVSADSSISLFPEMAYEGGNAIIAWQTRQGARRDIDTRRVTPTGATVQATVTASGLATINNLPSITWDGTAFSAYWVGDDSQIHTRALPLSGTGIGELVLSALGSATAISPSVTSAWNGGSDVMLAWPDGTRNNLGVARVSGGSVIAGPTLTPAPTVVSPDAVWTGSRLGVLYLETSGLVQVHLAQFAADTTFIDDTPIVNASTSSDLMLAWAGDRYVAAVDVNGKVIVKFVTPP